jgi:hypothetical protein
MKKTIWVSSMLFFGIVVSALAQKPEVVVSDKPGWHKIGEVTASFKMKNESIVVMGADEFKAIKLKVTDAPIDIENVTVYYESGNSQEIPVKGMLQSGAETKVFDLDRPTDDLKKVSFTYKSEPNYRGDKAHVELYGQK